MLYAIFAVLVIILDQGTKLLVSNSVPVETGGETFIPGILSIVHVNNDGAAFSFLAGSGARIFFIILTGVFTIAVIVALATKFISGPLARWSIVLVTAGGISNCIDRVIYGYVVDMFKLEPINFPVFNVADIFITVFALLFVLAIIFERDRRTEDDFLDDEFDEDDEDEDDYEEEERPRRLSRKEKRAARRAARYDDEEDEDEDEEEDEEPAPKKSSRKQKAAIRKAAREEEDYEDEDEEEPPVELPRPRRASVKKQPAVEPRSVARAPVTTHTSKSDAEYEQVLARRQQAAAAQTAAPAPTVEVEIPAPAPAPAPVRPAVKPQPAPAPVVEVKPAPSASAEEFSLDDILAEFR